MLGEECERSKPFPDPYLKAMQLLGSDPEASVVLEDSPSGIQAGCAAKMRTVGVTTGHTSEELKEAGATVTVSNYHELLQMMRTE